MKNTYATKVDAYGRARYAEGLRLLLNHQRTPDGWCAGCGQRGDCDGRREGDRLVQLYAEWGERPEPPAEPTTDLLVRPYVRPEVP